MTHTPGPWKIEPDIYSKDRWYISGAEPSQKFIADVWQGDNKPDGEANARLIAAAPDLLAAMESFELYPCVGESCRTEYPTGLCPGCLARAAIAQAKETK